MQKQFQVGDRVICTDEGPNHYISTGKEYTVEEVSSSGLTIRVNNDQSYMYPMSRFELVAAAVSTSFKAGDKVRCTNKSNYGRIQKDGEYVIESVRARAYGKKQYIKFVNNDYDDYESENFELVSTAPTLKLPMAAKRATGRDIVLVAGSVAGKVTMIYADGSGVFTDQFTEAEVIEKFEVEAWSVNGPESKPELASRVLEAQANLQAAKDAVTVAEAALATAEAAMANNKPYLA